MVEYGIPILYTLFVWWFSTGIIMFLDGLPRKTFPWSVAGAAVTVSVALKTCCTRVESRPAPATITGLARPGWPLRWRCNGTG